MLQDGTNTYVYGLDLISATDGSGDQTYFLYDGLGSVTDLTDDEGDAVDDYTYDVFGAIRSHSGSSDNPWLFTGEEFDNDEELYYLRARYYDPAIGRFLTQDPIPTGNLYVYTGNNPVRYVDPYGLFDLNPIDDIVDCAKDPKQCAENVGDEIKKGVEEAGDFITNTACRAATATVEQILNAIQYCSLRLEECAGRAALLLWGSIEITSAWLLGGIICVGSGVAVSPTGPGGWVLVGVVCVEAAVLVAAGTTVGVLDIEHALSSWEQNGNRRPVLRGEK